MMLTLHKTLLAALLITFSSLAIAASGLAALAPEAEEMEGTIQSLDIGAGTMIFEGLRFHMAPELEVEIQGGYGAFTMLAEGMKASVTYRIVSGSERHAIRIIQLPDNIRLEGS